MTHDQVARQWKGSGIMVTQFPLDFMHLICLGVVKKMIGMWMEVRMLHVPLGSNTIRSISETIMMLQSYLSREFGRKGTVWKKKTGVRLPSLGHYFCKLDQLSDIMYSNFIMLHASVYLLYSKAISADQYDFIERLLKSFVVHFGEVYGPQLLIYNVHGLIHIVEHSRKYGALPSFSGFPFENFL